MIASISYPPIPLFELGPLRMSLHGLMAGLGFAAGAVLMVREARRRAFDEAAIASVLTWALVGAILGARLFTVPAHLGDPGYGPGDIVAPAGFYSIMGGFAGGILAALLRIRRLGLAPLPHLDMAAFGLALGTVVGRLGDLFIVEHLGAPTSFFLGYEVGPGSDLAPQHDGLEALCDLGVTCGPYHHAALYDLLGAAALLGVLFWVARRWSRIRYGMLFVLWVGWYGLQRFAVDFTRNTGDGFAELLAGLPDASPARSAMERIIGSADATLGPLTWNQWSGLLLGLSAVVVLAWMARTGATRVVSADQDRAYGAGVARAGSPAADEPG